MQACCVEYITLAGDNLASMFPGAHLNLGGLNLNSEQLFALTTAIAVLPTVWLRDQSLLSYLSGDFSAVKKTFELFFSPICNRSFFISDYNVRSIHV